MRCLAALPQTAVEALIGQGVANARITQVAVEALANLTGPGGEVAEEIRETQAALEYAHRTDGVDQTQAVLEVLQKSPPAAAVVETQAALEHIWLRPNETWESQVCLEVIGPTSGIAVSTVRNYAYTGVWAHTPPGTVTVAGGNWSGMTQACLEIIIPAADWPV